MNDYRENISLGRRGLHYAASLVCFSIWLVGCQSRDSFESPPSNRSADESARQRNPLQSSLLEQADDGFWQLPWISLGNTDRCAAEINKRGIERIELQKIADHRQQSAVLQQLCTACPQITALSIRDWTLSSDDLRHLFRTLTHLRTLELSSVRLTASEDDNSIQHDWIPRQLAITKLFISGCHALDNDTVGKLLEATPKLEELSIREYWSTTGVYDGEGWPLNGLTQLRNLSITTSAGDEFIHRLLRDVPNLQALHLWDCAEITGSGWMPAHSMKELKIVRCPKVSDQAVRAIVKHAPWLESLLITSFEGVMRGDWDLTPLTKLRQLHVVGPELSGFPVAQALPSLKDLESLKIFTAGRSEQHALDFSTLTKLQSLSIRAAALSPEVLATLPTNLNSLHLEDCALTRWSLVKTLRDLPNLQSLRLHSNGEIVEHRADTDATTRVTWSFAAQQKLADVFVIDCPFVTDAFVSQIAGQCPNVESLSFWSNDQLTGKGWNLQQLRNLKSLELRSLESLENGLINQLPESLESLKIIRCPKMTGQGWHLASLPELSDLQIRNCVSLSTLGTRLPASMRALSVFECVNLKTGKLNYAGLEKLETLSFAECHQVNVDRLFAALPRHLLSLRRLNLTGCPNLTSTDWDLSPLRDTLHEIIYCEGEPSYVGGIDEANRQLLKKQLPDSKIIAL